MQALTLPSGAVFQSFWGGELRPARKLSNGVECGDYCAVRNYHDLEAVEVDGVEWVKATDSEGYIDYKSICGYYHIAVYNDWRGGEVVGKLYYAFECSTWREDMQSTFGKYVSSTARRPFYSFEDAAQHVAEVVKNA